MERVTNLLIGKQKEMCKHKFVYKIDKSRGKHCLILNRRKVNLHCIYH